MNTRYVRTLPIALAVTLAMAVSFPLIAQEEHARDSVTVLEHEIFSPPDSDLTLLKKTRAVLLESIRNGDSTRTNRVLLFMQERFDPSQYVTLFDGEKILIGFWTCRYDSVLAWVSSGSIGSERDPQKRYPEEDGMFDALRDESRKAQPHLIRELRASGLEDSKTDFLDLLLTDVIGPEDDADATVLRFQTGINDAADSYLATYKDSEFNGFIRDQIRYLITRSDWGWGYEVGAGYLALPPDLSGHMKDFGLLSIALEGTYREGYACLRVDIGAAHHINRGFVYDGEWKEGLSVMHVGVLLAGGEKLSLWRNLIITPTIGIGVIDFSPPEEERNQDGNNVSMTVPAFALGANFDVPLADEPMATSLRLNIGYRVAMTNNALARGGYTFITLGVNFFNRPAEVAR